MNPIVEQRGCMFVLAAPRPVLVSMLQSRMLPSLVVRGGVTTIHAAGHAIWRGVVGMGVFEMVVASDLHGKTVACQCCQPLSCS